MNKAEQVFEKIADAYYALMENEKGKKFHLLSHNMDNYKKLLSKSYRAGYKVRPGTALAYKGKEKASTFLAEHLKKNKKARVGVIKTSAKKNKEFSFKEFGYGTVGGAVGAVMTQPIDTVATVGQKEGKGIFKTIKQLNNEAVNGKTIKPAQKAIKLMRRYNAGLGAKILKIGPATGIAWATANYLKNKLG